jgi:phosphatidylserine decarboxylase
MSKLFVLLQLLIPKHFLTAMVYRLARVNSVPIKNWLISRFIAAFDVDIDEIAVPVPAGFSSFNDFFTRELAPDARPIDPDSDTMVSPVDGTVSACGRISGDALIQAKGISYTLTELLQSDLDVADSFVNGSFATVYLAPYNYHRVHCPISAELTSALYVPGSLFSVNEATVANLPGLFIRNERLVCQFRTDIGPVVLVFVGALNVGSISTPWTGEIRPRRNGLVQLLDIKASGHSRDLAKGDLLGWFNMGSTIVLLTPGDRCHWLEHLTAGSRLKMGESIARIEGRPG